MEGGASALINAAKLAGEEYRLLRGVGSNVAELRDDLATMNAVLRMKSEAEDDTVVDHFTEEWMKQLRELSYDSDDCIDKYKLRIKSRPNDGLSRWLRRHVETLFPRHQLAGEISALRARAITISERHARYGLLNSKAIRRSPMVPVPVSVQASSSLHGANNLEHFRPVGIDDQAIILVKKLKEGEKQLRVFSIVGFGGLGKTTLALEVCRRLEEDFKCLALVSVSQAFEPSLDMEALLKRLLHEILKPTAHIEEAAKIEKKSTLGDIKTLTEEDLTKADKEEAGTMNQKNSILEKINAMSEKELTETLWETVKNKRYLIVVDDVWTTQALNAIVSMMPDNDNGSRLIVTTRILSVAEEACSRASDIHKMLPLKPEDSKKLFVSRVFGADQSCPKYLAEVMGDILKKCGGLPLAIVCIASFLAAYKSPGSKDKWDIVCKSIGSQMEDGHPTLEGMKHILTLSYNHLPHELKDCMMYLSIFPEDYEINKERLLNRWIAEGLIPEKRGLTLKQVAESYFDELLGRSMIVPSSFDRCGRVESCRVHDILLELMVSMSLKSNFASLLGGQYAGMLYDRIRRLSIQGPDSDITESANKKKIEGHGWGHGLEGMDVQHVRSLSLFHAQECKLLDHLDKFTLLRVLDLEGCKELKNKHMNYICRLYLLKFLSLKNTGISKVPGEIEKLEHLQVLDLRGNEFNRWQRVLGIMGKPGVSDKVTELKKLEHLLFSGIYDHCWILPTGVGKMKALRTVGKVVLENDDKIAQELGELKQLETLWINIYNRDRDRDSMIAEEFVKSLAKMISLRCLNIEGGIRSDGLKFLHNLKPGPRFLRDIRIHGKVGDSLPDWIGKLSNLVEFCMENTLFLGDQPFSVLCQLACLKSIKMGQLSYTDVKLVVRARYTIDVNFPSLLSLDLSADYDIEIQEGSMTELERLGISMNRVNPKDRRIVGIKHLINLKEVQLTGPESDPLLRNTLEQLKTVNETRTNKFRIVVKYW